jgi:hypothetical protein
MDTHGGKVLVQGRYFEPFGQGFSILSTLVEYPGATRLVSPFSTFPDGIPSNDSIQIGQGLYDSDGTVVFGFRRVQSPNVLFTAIARYSSGTITILARSGVTPMPGVTNTFTMVGPFSTAGGTTFFYGEGAGGKNGLYELSSGTITKVLESGDPFPAGIPGTVSILGSSGVAFANEGPDVVVTIPGGGGAVFKRINGTWSLVIKQNTSIPDGVGIFFDLEAPSIHGGKVMFFGDRNNIFALPLQLGLYVESGGGIAPVVDLNASFGGITVASMLVPTVGGRYWDGQNVVLNVGDQGGATGANYLATPAASTTNSLRISSFDLGGAGGAPRLTFQTVAGVTNRIEQSTDLASWSAVTNLAGNGATITVVLPSGGGQRFFRLVLP